MEHQMHYGTVSEAITAFKKQGFTVDFNLKENCIVCNDEQFDADDFEIVDTYRYEGSTDPGDEAVVYAIESKNGMKGILVMGYGAYSDAASENIIKRLHYRNK